MYKIPKRFDHDKQLPAPPPPPPFKPTPRTRSGDGNDVIPPVARNRTPAVGPGPASLEAPSEAPAAISASPTARPDVAVGTPNPAARPASVNSSGSSLYAPKTLKRRNLKQLKIDGAALTVGDRGGAAEDRGSKTTTDELVSSMNNLELGVEYQMAIKPEDLLTLKKLGSGNSGTVTKVLHLPSKKTMARKVIHIETKEKVLTQIIRELRIMHECDSQYIIGFYGAFLKEGDVVICMEYSECGSLDKVLRLSGPFPEYTLKQTAYSVLKGLIYLYDTHKIIHRDVKPSNVLMDAKGNMKLCDFGVSRELINSIADTFVGTSTYMSPERIQGNRYNVKGDVWSLGLMMVELATGVFPFGDSSKMAPEGILDLLQRIVNEKPPSLRVADGYSAELCDFVDQCLKKEHARPEPQDLVRHPFLADATAHRQQVKAWAKNVRKLQKGKILVQQQPATSK